MVEILHGANKGKKGKLVCSFEERCSFGTWAYVDVEIYVRGAKSVITLMAGSIRNKPQGINHDRIGR